jgi:hypothetical protein
MKKLVFVNGLSPQENEKEKFARIKPLMAVFTVTDIKLFLLLKTLLPTLPNSSLSLPLKIQNSSK